MVSEISTDKTSSLSENPSVLSAYDASSTSGLLSPADNQTDKEFFQSHDSIIAGICEGRSSSSVALFKALALGGSGLYPLEILRSSRSHGVKDLLRSSFRVKRSPCNENQVLYCLALIDQAGSRSIVLSRLNEERVYLLWREVVDLADDVRGRSDDVLGKDFSDAVLRVLGVLKNDASKLGLPWWLFCDNRLAALSPEVGALGEVVHLVVIANLGAKIDQLSGEQLDTLRLWLKSPIGVDFEWHPIARQLAKRFMELSGVISKKHAKVVALLELCSAMASRGL